MKNLSRLVSARLSSPVKCSRQQINIDNNFKQCFFLHFRSIFIDVKNVDWIFSEDQCAFHNFLFLQNIFQFSNRSIVKILAPVKKVKQRQEKRKNRPTMSFSFQNTELFVNFERKISNSCSSSLIRERRICFSTESSCLLVEFEKIPLPTSSGEFCSLCSLILLISSFSW